MGTMHEAQEPANVCHIARLPYELRQRIFRHALQRKGTLRLQPPLGRREGVWPASLCCLPLIARRSAEAFYRTNTFVWHVHRPQNADARSHSDPSNYALQGDGFKHSLTPRLPWQYPRLLEDLRYLVINIFLRSYADAGAWSTTFPQQMLALVTALEGGDKLKELQANILTGYWRGGRPVPPAYTKTLGMVAKLRVSGTVKVRARPTHNASWIPSISSLGLQEKMKV